jgi:voltage-gated potassium channel
LSRGALIWFGLGGVAEHDDARALEWQHRLHWAMVGIALLSVPAYLLDTAQYHPAWRQVANALDALIFAAFLGELLWMLRVTLYPGRYLARNWLNVIIVAASFASLLGAATEWVAMVRVLRVLLVGLVTLRALAEFRTVFSMHGASLVVGVACITLLIAGGLLYWVEPTVNSYWDGLWLAFVTGTTIGYGDLVPTTPAARVVAAFVVLIGVAVISVFTASIVAFFVGEDDKRLRRDLHREVQTLSANVSRLIGNEELVFHQDLHREIQILKREIAALREEIARHDRH